MTPARAMLFVDAQNLVLGAKQYNEDGLDYDIRKLVAELTGEHRLIRGYWFDSHRPGSREEKAGFYEFLETNGFRVESTELSQNQEGFKEKEADIRLATELIARGFDDAYDTAILVTGDRDFRRAIRYVQNQGKLVTVASFRESMAGRLRRVADEYIYLDEIAEEIELD